MAIAFFDLDKTLLPINSGKLWLSQELRLGRVGRWQALRAAAWLFQYSVGIASLEQAIREAIGSLQGSEAKELRDRLGAFYQSSIHDRYRPGGRQALEAHRRAGDRLVLLTSSPSYISDLVATELKLDEVLCNRFEVDEIGRHTGKTVGEICFGRGKAAHAKLCADRLGAALSEATFYTDSYTDLPALAAVGHPVAVNPDFRLRREALRRGWPVVDWGVPSK